MCDFGFGDFGRLACGGQGREQVDDVIKLDPGRRGQRSAEGGAAAQDRPDSVIGSKTELQDLV